MTTLTTPTVEQWEAFRIESSGNWNLEVQSNGYYASRKVCTEDYYGSCDCCTKKEHDNNLDFSRKAVMDHVAAYNARQAAGKEKQMQAPEQVSEQQWQSFKKEKEKSGWAFYWKNQKLHVERTECGIQSCTCCIAFTTRGRKQAHLLAIDFVRDVEAKLEARWCQYMNESLKLGTYSTYTSPSEFKVQRNDCAEAVCYCCLEGSSDSMFESKTKVMEFFDLLNCTKADEQVTNPPQPAAPNQEQTENKMENTAKNYLSELLEATKDGAAMGAAAGFSELVTDTCVKHLKIKGLKTLDKTKRGREALLLLFPALLGLLLRYFPDVAGTNAQKLQNACMLAFKGQVVRTVAPYVPNIRKIVGKLVKTSVMEELTGESDAGESE